MTNTDQTQLISKKAGTALVLGATGGFGSELIKVLARAGWQVRGLSRKPQAKPGNSAESVGISSAVTERIEWFIGDLENVASLQSAAANVGVIVHAVNVPYQQWDPLMVQYTQTIIKLARDNDAHLLFVGNVYNAGIPIDGLITEHTIDSPIGSKGMIRAKLERMICDETRLGLRATVMRFGDFFGPDVRTSNWFVECTKHAAKNRLTSAGPEHIPHTWAYLPDAAVACEQVLSLRMQNVALPAHMVLPFAGHVFSFEQLKQAMEKLSGKPIKMGSQPWGLFKVLAWVMPMMRELISMRYLWNHDIRMDGSALERVLGHKPQHTPLEDAVLACIPSLRRGSRISAVDSVVDRAA